jgi:DNA modification methylase
VKRILKDKAALSRRCVMIYKGDCLEVLKTLPDQSVHCVVTSPPYWGLRDYGVDGQLGLEKDFRDYVTTLVSIFREVKRVLRNDGTLWLNLGDSYSGYHGNKNSIIPTSSVNGWMKGTNENKRTNRAPKALGLKPKDLVGIPWRVAFALQEDGWWLRSDIIWSKPNA